MSMPGAEAAPEPKAKIFGPYNAEVIAGGPGLAKPLAGMTIGEIPSGPFARPAQVSSLPAGARFTLHAWVFLNEDARGRMTIAGIGEAGDRGRYIGLDDGQLAFWLGARFVAKSAAQLGSRKWHFIAASFDGETARLYLDGEEVAHGAAASPSVAARAQIGPRKVFGDRDVPFAGHIAGFTDEERTLSAREITALHAAPPDFSLVVFEPASPNWSVQTRQMVGQAVPQDAWTLPKSRAPFSKPRAAPVPERHALAPRGDNLWVLGRWQMRQAPHVSQDGAAISRPGYGTSSWYDATVPGTVLTTLVDSGRYPDPDYGLNNLAIPESLNKQDYWYRTEFVPPANTSRRRQWLTFGGINYAAQIWLNGKRIGRIKGAFKRGIFDVTDVLIERKPNALAVLVSPPPHPGIAHEQSISAGAGENGGMMALDGPTFIASEGWDWIPGVRDRNTGLWQEVTLGTTGPVRLGDAHVITALPRADNSLAIVEIDVPLQNLSDNSIRVEINASFDNVNVVKTVDAPPGGSTVKLEPSEFPQLAVQHPRLWWPNGYGAPALHTLHLAVSADGKESDAQDIRFGMREITYEISLFDSKGHLRRVEIDPSEARAEGKQIVDVRHEAIRRADGGFADWAASLTAAGETSPAVKPIHDTAFDSPSLILKVNGVRIAARGGNWGMDDWRKRISRERLEPYFRLHREANLNIIRNWVGQSTEPVFYDLADEYGILVVNDFWESTQNYQLEAADPSLFLDNAADVIARYRNHPSIAVWIGRNEGVPQPPINEGLEKLVRDLDGTRYYTGSSNFVNLGLGGPYNHQDPSFYYNYWGTGFSMEVGVPSFPTLEAFQAAIPKADQWPMDDVWAYHDWHQAGNGDTRSFLKAMTDRFGAPHDLPDFERKAQLMNFEAHRAVFEGMNAGLWTKTSGRLLWMSHPAWPSTVWQIYSSDYDTHAAFYGVKSAAEPVHVQLDLPGNEIAIVNNTRAPLKAAKLRARILTLAGKLLSERTESVDISAGAVKQLAPLDFEQPLEEHGALLVKLDLADASGKPLSSNLYWPTKDAAAGKPLDALPKQSIAAAARKIGSGGETHIQATLTNDGDHAALLIKLTLLDRSGARVLPVYYSDNYVSLLPGETRDIDIAAPNEKAHGPLKIAVRGWNARPISVAVAPC